VRVAIALGWAPKELFVHEAKGRLPYVGVYCVPQPWLSDRLRDDLTSRQDWAMSSENWPCYRYVEPSPNRSSPRAYADGCIEALHQAWEELAGPVDEIWRGWAEI
jgi:hypothetical protein